MNHPPTSVSTKCALSRPILIPPTVNFFINRARDPTTRALTSTKKKPVMSEHPGISKLDKKDYDLPFLKKYITQALSPHTLDLRKRFPSVDSDALLQHARYLRTVRDNVHTIVDGILTTQHTTFPPAEGPVPGLRVEKRPVISPAKKQDIWRPIRYDDVEIPKRSSRGTVRVISSTQTRGKEHREQARRARQLDDKSADAPTRLEALLAQSIPDIDIGKPSSLDAVSRLEQLVAQCGPEIVTNEQQPALQFRGTSRDRAAARRLVDAHLERMASKFGCSVDDFEARHSATERQDIKSTVRTAVDNGILRAPTPRTQKKIAEHARKQREEWAATDAECAERERVEQAIRAEQENADAEAQGPAGIQEGQQYPGYLAAAGSISVKPSSGAPKQKLGAKAPKTPAKTKVVTSPPSAKRPYQKKNAAYWNKKTTALPAVGAQSTRIDSPVAEAQGKRAASPLTGTERKRQRTTITISPQHRKKSAKVKENQPLPPHPSGSKTLEPHQILPPDAFFEEKHIDDKLVWRCHVQHALGYYYNAGDRKSCRGCNTNISAGMNKIMDFYMPHNTVFYQPTAPEARPWLPNALSRKPTKYKASCHNAIAKEAFWEARNSGASEEDAREQAVAHLLEYLRPKPKPEHPRSPTPSPEPKPIDLGHPSGSKTMEHTQDLPSCASFNPPSSDSIPAWRCDGAHAFGRYYMCGTKRSCPGCGLSKTGTGKQQQMDFYMPAGAVGRQEANPELMVWKPRRPNKVKKWVGMERRKKQAVWSHNQMVAGEFWKIFDAGCVWEEEALKQAKERVDEMLDAKCAGGEGENDESSEEEVVRKPAKKGEKEKKRGGRKKVVEAEERVLEETGGVLMGPAEEGERVHPVAQEISCAEEVVDISSAEEDPSSGSDSE